MDPSAPNYFSQSLTLPPDLTPSSTPGTSHPDPQTPTSTSMSASSSYAGFGATPERRDTMMSTSTSMSWSDRSVSSEEEGLMGGRGSMDAGLEPPVPRRDSPASPTTIDPLWPTTSSLMSITSSLRPTLSILDPAIQTHAESSSAASLRSRSSAGVGFRLDPFAAHQPAPVEEEKEEEGEEEGEHPPLLLRTSSAPLPARVGYLRHPHSFRGTPSPMSFSPSRSSNGSISSVDLAPPPVSSDVPPPRPSPTHTASTSALQTLSYELADNLQSAIQTLLHLSPPHLLDNAKEQYAGCTVQMPTTSLSALLTAMKGLNYLSANVQQLCLEEANAGSSTASSNVSLAPSRRQSAASSRSAPPSRHMSTEPETFRGSRTSSPSSSSSSPVIGRSGRPAAVSLPLPGILDNAIRQSSAENFDIGEMLQSTADLLGGQAAQAGVEIVLFHGDVGMKHVSVVGDGEGISYALSVVVRQILATCKPGDCLELGLQLFPQSPSMTPRVNYPNSASDIEHPNLRRTFDGHASGRTSPGETMPAPHDALGGPLLCTFEIVHNARPKTQILSPVETPKAELPAAFEHMGMQGGEKERVDPNFEGLLCRRILKHVNASLRVGFVEESPPLEGTQMPTPTKFFELSVLLPRGEPIVEPSVLSEEEQAARQPFPSLRLAREPTLGELSQFAETLRGRKVELHARLTSLFARHLTSYLAAWGMEISHTPTDDHGEDNGNEEKGLPPFTSPSESQHDSGYGGSIGSTPDLRPLDTSSNTYGANGSSREDRLIIIDDDVGVLKKQLLKIRAESPMLNLRPKNLKRPTLANRAKSSPQVRQIQAQNSPQGQAMPPKSNVVVIHFTSLANYNQVRDVVSGILAISPAASMPQFEVMVIPKPVGPRRFLTALHTAAYRPIVDPYFSPIATSPRSPGGGYFSVPLRQGPEPRTGMFDPVIEEGSGEEPESGADNPPSGHMRQSSSTESNLAPGSSNGGSRFSDPLGLAISTPSGEVVATSAMEYFSDAAAKLGGSGASGMMVQSPDGRPFGMFFEPPSRGDGRRPSYSRVESTRKKSFSKNGAPELPGSVSNSSPGVKRVPEPVRRRNSSKTLNGDDEEDDLVLDMASSKSRGGSSRRKTLPPAQTPTPSGFPSLAIPGRDRSATVTQSSRPRTSLTMSPSLSQKEGSPKEAGSASASPSAETPVTDILAKLPSKKALAIEAKAAARALAAEQKAAVVVPKLGPAAAKKAANQGVVVPPINVLIVEDNPINQNILSMFLRKKKIKHQAAKDGQEAVDKWRTGVFHLILMDIQLPVMSGIEATKEIRRLERNNNIGVFPNTPTLEVPPTASPSSDHAPDTPLRSSVIIVALTASSLQQDRVNALAAGCNDFLTKPVSLKWLENKIVEWGCMQALIDFEGWRRWKTSDAGARGPADVKRAFQLGNDAKAKSVADRLRIDRTPKLERATSSASISPSQTVTLPLPAVSTPTTNSFPSIQIEQPTPTHKVEGQPEHTTLPTVAEDSVVGLKASGIEALQEGLEVAREEEKDGSVIDGRANDLVEGDTTKTPVITPRQSLSGAGTPMALTNTLADTSSSTTPGALAPSPDQTLPSIATDSETKDAPDKDPTRPVLHSYQPGRLLLDPEAMDAEGADDGPEPLSEPSSGDTIDVPVPRGRTASSGGKGPVLP